MPYQDALEVMPALPVWPEARPSEMTGRNRRRVYATEKMTG